MNRTKKVLLHFVLCMFTCFTLFLAGCTFQLGGLVQIEGAYKFQKMSYQQGGMTIELEAGEKFMGMITFSEDYMTLTLNENGTAVMVMSDGESMETGNGTWTKIDNNTLQITIEGEPENVQWSGNTITMENDGATVILKK